LKAAKSDPVDREIKDPKAGRIIERETPQWFSSRSRLCLNRQDQLAGGQRPAVRLEAKDRRLRALEDVRQLCLQLAEARHDVAQVEASLAALVVQRPALDANVSRCRVDREDARAEHRRHPTLYTRSSG
jgi:hypothetical protein